MSRPDKAEQRRDERDAERFPSPNRCDGPLAREHELADQPKGPSSPFALYDQKQFSAFLNISLARSRRRQSLLHRAIVHLREVFVPASDRIEWLVRFETHNLVRLAP